jgi:hypothetical protein
MMENQGIIERNGILNSLNSPLGGNGMLNRKKSGWIAALAMSGLVVQPRIGTGEEKPAARPVRAQESRAQSSPAQDVALTADGALSGRVFNAQGKPLDGVVVSLQRRGDETARETTSDSEGRIKFTKVRGGLYQVRTPQSEGVYRLWPADAAPDQSMKTVVMSGSGPVMRGQFGYLDPANTTAILLGVAGVTLSAITLSEVNDLRDDVDRIPTSP